ncbi:TerB family tellurite resistance protein [Halochromatium glycolicum]|uniref:Co-chaperone DjlA N-terminal domain-containing protein n=1 Tax=Halochromatium glycolicum TaxID=85075 RepID=A0AAJ0U1B5_9GAMM|nr:TerB family tellurite resistance protein [Halochromatium glycolicum]MBK1703421.1 hypothetical protein [Halochromatium glycolicum]
MIDRIRRFFDEHVLAPRPDGSVDEDHAMRCAAAALILEMTHMEEDPSERGRGPGRDLAAQLVRERFELPADEAQTLLECAEAERREATDYFQFTRLINERFAPEQKIALIESLWRVAYADDRLTTMEEYLVRKVAELLYVPHAAFINAKHRVEAERPR